MKDVKAVLLDFGGTLDSDGISWPYRFFPLYRKYGVKWGWDEFIWHFDFADDFLNEKKLKKESYAKTIFLQTELLLKHGGIRDKALAKRISDDFVDEAMRFMKRNRPILSRLSKKYKLGIVSNFYGNVEPCLKSAGLARTFDVIVDSGVVGCLKPDPRIFHTALSALKVGKDAAVMVGDSMSRDMRGAKDLGMRHIWLMPPKRLKIRDKQGRLLRACCKGDTIIKKLTELERFL
jgi:putative hydrolase of the HAD superfamily